MGALHTCFRLGQCWMTVALKINSKIHFPNETPIILYVNLLSNSHFTCKTKDSFTSLPVVLVISVKLDPHLLVIWHEKRTFFTLFNPRLAHNSKVIQSKGVCFPMASYLSTYKPTAVVLLSQLDFSQFSVKEQNRSRSPDAWNSQSHPNASACSMQSWQCPWNIRSWSSFKACSWAHFSTNIVTILIYKCDKYFKNIVP